MKSVCKRISEEGSPSAGGADVTTLPADDCTRGADLADVAGSLEIVRAHGGFVFRNLDPRSVDLAVSYAELMAQAGVPLPPSSRPPTPLPARDRVPPSKRGQQSAQRETRSVGSADGGSKKAKSKERDDWVATAATVPAPSPPARPQFVASPMPELSSPGQWPSLREAASGGDAVAAKAVDRQRPGSAPPTRCVVRAPARAGAITSGISGDSQAVGAAGLCVTGDSDGRPVALVARLPAAGSVAVSAHAVPLPASVAAGTLADAAARHDVAAVKAWLSVAKASVGGVPEAPTPGGGRPRGSHVGRKESREPVDAPAAAAAASAPAAAATVTTTSGGVEDRSSAAVADAHSSPAGLEAWLGYLSLRLLRDLGGLDCKRTGVSVISE